MTRDYNKQRRDDMRPSSRNQSTNRYRNEQPPRPARPRLNRETVDRAWEAGAATQHPDYRPRRSNASNGQPPRDNWRYNQSSEHSSAQNGRKPYRNQVDRNRRFERNGDNNPGFRSHPYNSGRGGFDDQRTNRPGYRDNSFSQTNERRSPYRGNDQKRDNQRRYPENSERQPRDVGRSIALPRATRGAHASSDATTASRVSLNLMAGRAQATGHLCEMPRIRAGRVVPRRHAGHIPPGVPRTTASPHRRHSLKATMSVSTPPTLRTSAGPSRRAG